VLPPSVPRSVRRLDDQDDLAVTGRELAVVRTDEARASVAVVAGAVLGHGAFIDHD
jgi:hypothetical protein